MVFCFYCVLKFNSSCHGVFAIVVTMSLGYCFDNNGLLLLFCFVNQFSGCHGASTGVLMPF